MPNSTSHLPRKLTESELFSLKQVIKDGCQRYKLEDVSSKVITAYLRLDNKSFNIAIENKLSDSSYDALKNYIKEYFDAGVVEFHSVIPKKHNTSNFSAEENKLMRLSAKQVIMVASGKGGVGKSTIAALLALALNDAGYKVGLADIDIYGPSIPHLFNITSQVQVENDKFIPHTHEGIKLHSIGLLTQDTQGIMWRGPMAIKAMHQILVGTDWGELDVLIVDSPPGTGDLHLSLIQNYYIDGILLATTPHKLAMADTIRSYSLYKQFKLPMLGVIENMGYIEGSEDNKFGDRKNLLYLSKSLSLPIIAHLPYLQSIAMEGSLKAGVKYMKQIIGQIKL